MLFQPPRRTAKDYILPFLIILAGGILILLLFKVVPQFLDKQEVPSGQSGTAELNQISGESEAYLPAAGAWKIIDGTATLNPGESVRTAAESQATLKFDDGTIVSLGPVSQIKINELYNSLTKKTVALYLEQGSAGISANANESSDFSLRTAFLKLYKADGKFLLTIGDKETSATAIQGGFAAKIIDPQQEKELPDYVVEEGQTLTISERRINLLRIGGEIDLIKPTPEEIRSSSFYTSLSGTTAATGTGAPDSSSEAATNTATTTNPTAETKTTDPASAAGGDTATLKLLAAPIVTTGNGNITATKEPLVISGTASPAAAKIEITPEGGAPYVLTKFVAESGQWSYNVAVKFGNLKEGKNAYTVVALDAAGNRSPATTFLIDYQTPTQTGSENKPENTAIPAEATNPDTTSGVPLVGSATFAEPTIIEPQAGQTFTAEPIHLEGSAPAGTKEILVNEYKLTGFNSGDTVWKYNAKQEYGNLNIGENEYEITAVSATGERSSVTIKIIYQPE